MNSFLLKIIVCPISLIVLWWLLPNIEYGAYYQPIIVGLVLAVAGVLMEYLFLKKGTLWTSVAMDFVASVLLVYFISNWFPTANVTFFGAILVGLVLGVIEYFTHRWLLRQGKTRKSPA